MTQQKNSHFSSGRKGDHVPHGLTCVALWNVLESDVNRVTSKPITKFFFSFFFKAFLTWTIFSLYWISYSVASALVFWPRGMWDLRSLIRDPTCIPCTGRWSPNHWSTREVPITNFFRVESEKGCDCWKKQLGLIHQPKEGSTPLYSVYTPDWRMQSKRLSTSFLGLIINKLHNEGFILGRGVRACVVKDWL